MTDNTTASLENFTGTDYVEFGKWQDRLNEFSWFKIDSNYLDEKFKVLKKDGNRHFHLVHIITMGEIDFNQLMRLKTQLVIAAENFRR